MSQEQALIKVLVVDDQQIIREGISTILDYQAGLSVMGKAINGQEAVELALELKPDVVLMDVRMPIMNGVEATARLRQQLPSCKVLMLTTFDDEEYITEALRAGASGYLLKDIPGKQLAQAIRSVHEGLYQLDPAVASKLMNSLNRGRESAAPEPPPTPHTIPASNGSARRKFDLTERELDILKLLAGGATNREIAEQLFLAEGTVKNHVSNILVRLGLRHRTDAALFARENDLL
ncbi:MAG: response regulator transcription factor [Chloroflexi bacterium]|nr:response regulator transcription factor [Chloroflexota bacterium]OJW02705.1 MAG: DNA-binding response regulator [Chloroflexi bacterium 54-19]